jgi:fluoride ion exporter CrcB/FEX
MDILIVGLGGAFGGLARFEIGKLIARHTPNGKFSFATFIVNITGAVLLGMLSAAPMAHLYLCSATVSSAHIRLFPRLCMKAFIFSNREKASMR